MRECEIRFTSASFENETFCGLWDLGLELIPSVRRLCTSQGVDGISYRNYLKEIFMIKED